jgi:hypothetical protein
LELFSGEQQNLIHGNSTKDHFCKCAETSSCTNVFGSNNVCNCDAKTPDWARDEVVTINKKHLPMTGLTYGPITEDWQTMKFSVGPLKCSGSVPETVQPPSGKIGTKVKKGGKFHGTTSAHSIHSVINITDDYSSIERLL